MIILPLTSITWTYCQGLISDKTICWMQPNSNSNPKALLWFPFENIAFFFNFNKFSQFALNPKYWISVGGRQPTYCDVPGSPCLSKTGPLFGPYFSIFGSLSLGSLDHVLSLPGAKVVCWRPHLAGTRQHIGYWFQSNIHRLKKQEFR